ncbi:MAG: hypothetical protein ACREK2_10425 [Gemmatimonadota bacterium]
MNTRIPFLIVTFAIALPATAIAQAGGTDAVVDRPGIGTLVPALDRVDSETNELQALGRLALADVRVARVGSVLDGDDRATFEEALAKNRTKVDELRKFLTTTDLQIVGADDVAMTFRDFLDGNDVEVSDVVAVSVSGGTVTLFVDESTEESSAEEMIG